MSNSKKSVLILSGGGTDEEEISLLSAKNVEETLKKLGYNTSLVILRNNIAEFKDKLLAADVIFPIIHGKEGEAGDLQKYLETINVKYVGATSKACKTGWDKLDFKKFCEKAGILTPKYQMIDDVKQISFPFPFVIKPTDNGSTVDVYVAKNKKELDKVNLDALLSKYKKLMLEEYIQGVEVTVGILGNKALPILEIIPPNGELFDYKNKYNGKSQEIPFAPSLDRTVYKRVQQIAENIHKGLGYRHYSRIDFIIRGEEIFALEINTIPGLTSESLLPKQAKAAGISFDDFIEKLVEMGLNS